MARGVFKNLLGYRFGRLIVLARSRNNKYGNVQWLCLCDCNAFAIVQSGTLLDRSTQSCGCWKREAPRIRLTKHGKTKSKEYRVWAAMLERCINPRCASYYNYGERGIFVCDAWKDFANFYHDMGPRPSPHHTLERLDNDGPYSKENVIWTTRYEQNRNKRVNRLITFQGKTLCLQDWATALNLSQSCLWIRLSRLGWSVEKAFTTPVIKRSPHV